MKTRQMAGLCLVVLIYTPVLAQELSPPMSLQDVVAAYIENNLELEAARYRVERVRADQIAAQLRPNPGLSLTAENLAVSGPTPFRRLYEVAATYSETIELGGKRALRERTAAATVSAAELQFEDTMRRGVAAVKRLYFDGVLARSNLALSEESRATFNQLVQFNQTRFEEGAIPEVDLIKVRLERVKFEAAVRQAELAMRQATIRLMEKLGRSSSSTQALAGELSFAPVTTDLDAIRRFAMTERADVRAAAAELAAARERLALEQARGKADISPFAGYKRVGDDNTLLFGVNIPLKVRDHNQAEVARAEADIRTAQARLELARNRAAAEVEAAYVALQSASGLVEIFQADLLGQADETRTITLAAYEEGGSDLLPVLDAERTRSEVRQEYFKTLFDYQAGIIDLELAAGREIQP